MDDGRRMPNLDKLTRYWANRCLMCNTPWQECKERTTQAHMVYDTFCDAGEPECMRCKRFLGYTQNAIKAFHSDANNPEPECKCGNYQTCNEYPSASSAAIKAHIIPRSRIQAGETDWPLADIDAVSNIGILCKNCHRIDPEPLTQALWFKWLRDERNRQYEAMTALVEWGKDNPTNYDSPILVGIVANMLPDTMQYRDAKARELIGTIPRG